MKEMLEVTLPDGVHFNCGITKDNHLVSDTNDGSNWKELKTPLPEGKWSIYRNPVGNKIILWKNE
jgi:hypothetical protein